MFLVDTNVWLETLLGQSKSPEADAFFKAVSPRDFVVTDFTVHSIVLKLLRRGLKARTAEFLDDLLLEPVVRVVALSPERLPQVLKAITDFGLDYDDAYQYVAAESLGVAVVTFDADLLKTPRGGLSPLQATARYESTRRTP
jgi:predicted nucleic acid-binding protein